MRQNIFNSNMFQKVRTRDESRRLISRTAKKKRFACFTQTIGELLQRVDARCVERRHITKP